MSVPFRLSVDAAKNARWEGGNLIAGPRIRDGSGTWIKRGRTVSALRYVCPCGCRRVGTISVYRTDDRPSSPSWTWDGDRRKPTLSPSVWAKRSCGWHGHLIAGEWRSV